jgi:hypothetical protein
MAAEPSAGRVGGDSDLLQAAGVVFLTLLVAALNLRFGDTWGQGIHLAYSAAAAAMVIEMAVLSPADGERPRPDRSVLDVASFVLALLMLVNLADALGVDAPFEATGTIVWMGLILAGLMGWFAAARNSGISLLLALVTLIAVVLSFVDWVFEPEGVTTFRWLLLGLVLAFAGGAYARRESGTHHVVAFANAAGVALLALGYTVAVDSLFGVFLGDLTAGADSQAGVGWELVLLGGGLALVVFAVHSWAAGPGYLGVINLALFTAVAGTAGEDGPSLIGWPLALLLAAAGLLSAGLVRRASAASR